MISGRTGDQKWRTFARTVLNSGKDAPLRRAVERSGTIVTTQFCPAYIKYAGYDFREGQGALGVKRAAKRSGERRESGSCL